jgi:hypothetical protein
VVATMISRMIGTPVFSDRTEFSVTTGSETALFAQFWCNGDSRAGLHFSLNH